MENNFPLTAAEVRKAYAAAPLMQREDVGSRFAGIEVVWEVSFYSASPSREGPIRVLATAGAGATYWKEHVSFSVDLATYPFLKVLEEGATLWVRGRISEVRSMFVELSDAQISLTNPASQLRDVPLLSAPPPEDGGRPTDEWYKRPIGVVVIGVIITVLGAFALAILSHFHVLPEAPKQPDSQVNIPRPDR